MDEPHRCRLKVGRDKVECPGDVRLSRLIATIKMLWNSVISSPGYIFYTMDNKNVYLNTPLDRYICMHLHINIIPDEIIEHSIYRKT